MFNIDSVEEAEIQSSRRWKRRKRIVKIIIVAIIIAALLLSVLIYFIIKKASECSTKECLLAAKLKARIDPNMDPCDDFYEFSCGTFIKNTVIPKNKAAVSSFTSVSDKVVEQLRDVLQEPILEEEPRSFGLAKHFYKLCIDEGLDNKIVIVEKIEKDGLEPMKNLLKHLGGWPVLEGKNWDKNNFIWEDVIYKMSKLGLDTNILLKFQIVIDFKNNNKYVMQVSQPDYGYSRNLFLVNPSNNMIQSLYNFMVETAVSLGANKTFAEEEFKDVFLFYQTLVRLSLNPVELRNATKEYNPMTIQEMQFKYPYINWLTYINNILQPSLKINESQIIINQTPQYLEKFKLIFLLPRRAMANFMLWSVVKQSISSLPLEVRKIRLKYEQAIFGILEDTPRWRECVTKTHENMGLLTGALYIRKYFNKNSKKKAMEMVNNLKAALLELILKNDWMDDITKQRALEKANLMSVNIAYPDELLDDKILDDFYRKLDVTENFLESELLNNLFMTEYSIQRLNKPVNDTEWIILGHITASVNAFYVFNKNIIGFPAGILQDVFFSSELPNYVNYGGIGYIIGHEMTHGFDDQGRDFDEFGNKVNWWTPKSEQTFNSKAECIVNQYNNYVIPEINTTINGVITQGENIADNGGLKEAYLAYRRWESTQEHPEPQLPGLPYTPHQLFWINAAVTWCSVSRPDFLRLIIQSDSHSVFRFRVNGPMSNLKEFSDDFNCPVGSNMNPVDKCHIW